MSGRFVSKNGLWLVDALTDRREVSPRILWVNETMGKTRINERRLDVSVRDVLRRLTQLHESKKITGLVAVTLRADGTMDVAAAGLAHDVPDLALGVMRHAESIITEWVRHPEDFEPDPVE